MAMRDVLLFLAPYLLDAGTGSCSGWHAVELLQRSWAAV
jgi:hypothetical protein